MFVPDPSGYVYTYIPKYVFVTSQKKQDKLLGIYLILMKKVVVNFSVDEKVMGDFRLAVVKNTGKSREMSRVIEGLMKEYIRGTTG